jgi:hypothetical protein
MNFGIINGATFNGGPNLASLNPASGPDPLLGTVADVGASPAWGTLARTGPDAAAGTLTRTGPDPLQSTLTRL